MNTAIDTAKTLNKISRKPNLRALVPSSDDPREELRRLVREHKAITKRAVSFESSVSPKKDRKTGEPIPNWTPADVKEAILATSKELKARAAKLEPAMKASLKKCPIYSAFLKHVFGLGPIVSAYLVAEVDIHVATKPSNLRRFCGLAVINGRLERPISGQKNAYSKEMRTRIYQAMSSMWKNAAKKTNAAPNGSTSKYLEIWRGTKVRYQSSPRYDAEKNLWLGVDGEADRSGAKAIAHSTGWHKAADVLLEDLYTVWRALEGLPVWPSYYAAKLGYEHGGKICVNEPKMLSLEEALEVVGFVGAKAIAGLPEGYEEEEGA